MNKYIVEIYLPAALQTYDVRIPANLPLHQFIALIGQAISRLSGGLYTADDNTILLQRESGAILNINMTPAELGLCNGSRLILI